MRIALIGPRGTGKTKVSLMLARSLKMPLLQLDTLISYDSAGKTIPELVAQNNGDWHVFRDIEFQVLQKAAHLEDAILDCGGGIVVDLDANNEEIFSEKKNRLLSGCIVFFLNAPLETIVAKITGDSARPSLSQTKNAEQIYYHRLPYYRRAARHEIFVEKGKRTEAALAILDILKEKYLLKL